MRAAAMLKPLLFRGSGEPTPLLLARMRMAKYAATRGWVVPLLTVRAGIADKWRRATKEDVIGFKYYLEIDELARKLIDQIIERVGPEDPIVDLGCNVGRELNHLWGLGYRRLTGVEIGVEPVRAMKEVFPGMSAGSRILNRSMTEAVRTFEDGEFDLVFAHGSLVSLNAREQFVFDEMCRITRKWIVTLENEWSLLLFPRDFGKVFTLRGLEQVHSETISVPSRAGEKQSVLRVFTK